MRLMVLAISNKLRLFFGILLAFILCQSTLFAQVSAPTSSYSSTTEYTVGGIQDDIFVFCDEVNNDIGELKAISLDGTSGWDFIWTKWDSGLNDFAIPVNTDNNVSESTISNLQDGRYQVNIRKGGVDNYFKVWVFIRTKSIEPSLILNYRDCSGISFNAALPVHEYQNIGVITPAVLSVKSLSSFVFTKNNIELRNWDIPNYDGGEKTFADDSAFEGEVTYKITVTDNCGFVYEKEYESISTYRVDATFTYTPKTGEAPLEVSFETDDANATDYQWYIYQDESRVDGPVERRDSLLTDITTGVNENFTYAYLHPGNYLVKLIVTNSDDSMNCVDVSDLETVTVEGSIFEVPNVFTPNGDGANDEFRLRLYSVKSYSVKIFNRWGRLVHEFQESDVSAGMADRKSSKGWDGKINGKLASPGTYFYVVEAEGREEEGRHYTEKGSLTLLHDK